MVTRRDEVCDSPAVRMLARITQHRRLALVPQPTSCTGYIGYISAWSAAPECHKDIIMASGTAIDSQNYQPSICAIITGGHTLRDELRQCMNDYTLQWRHQQTSKATVAELAVMACVSNDGPLATPEVVSWTYLHSHKLSSLINNSISGFHDPSRFHW